MKGTVAADEIEGLGSKRQCLEVPKQKIDFFLAMFHPPPESQVNHRRRKVQSNHSFSMIRQEERQVSGPAASIQGTLNPSGKKGSQQ